MCSSFGGTAYRYHCQGSGQPIGTIVKGQDSLSVPLSRVRTAYQYHSQGSGQPIGTIVKGQDSLSVPFSRVRTAYRYHCQGSGQPIVTIVKGQDSLSVPLSRVRHCKKNAGSRWKCGYVGDGAGSDRFSEKVKKAVRLEHREKRKGKAAHRSSTKKVTRHAGREGRQKTLGKWTYEERELLGQKAEIDERKKSCLGLGWSGIGV